MVMTKSLLFPRLSKASILKRSLHQSSLLASGGVGDVKWSWERNAGREVVGYGKDGDEGAYQDRFDFWYPSIRFRKVDDFIKPIRDKEKGDWKNLSIEEKKHLYRYSFMQTMQELDAIKPYWKLSYYWTAFGFVFVNLLMLGEYVFYRGTVIPSDHPEWIDAIHEKEVYLDAGYYNSEAALYDFENNKWK